MVTRAKQYQDAGRPVPFVQVQACAYLLEALIEAGPVKSDGMGNRVALDWHDLKAYADMTGAVTEAWEASMLRRMSMAFANGLQEGKSAFSIAPVDRDRTNG
jgi:hypothetical protein